ncbi:hypothetical protein ABZ358_12880 [Streptomyces mirabilis]
MYDEVDANGKQKWTVQQTAEEFGVTRPTIYRHLDKTIPAACRSGAGKTAPDPCQNGR